MMRLLVGVVALLAVTAGSAAGSATSEMTPVTITTTSCDGEPVVFTGEQHTVTHERVSKDGTVHDYVQVHETLDGVGTVTGTLYRLNDYQMTDFNLSVDPGTGTVSGPTTVHDTVARVVSEGATPNLYVFILTHVTLNANGEPTATVEDVRIDCSGQEDATG
jgi:hypothetical protein